MTTKILHISDTHLGNRQYRSDQRKEDFADAFEEAVQKAVERDVDAVIHTGDLFESRDPSIEDITRCIDILGVLSDEDIPFYGIVGNHESKMDEQWLDLLNRAGVAERLGKSATVVNDEVALYGIDSVKKPAWHSFDFTLEETDEDLYRILCMHELLYPPVPDEFSHHETSEVVERLNIEIDALALGDYHKPEETVVDGVDVWYPGSTERCSAKEAEQPRGVELLIVEDGKLTKKRLETDARKFITMDIEFEEDDGYGFAESEIEKKDVEDKVIRVDLTGERTPVSSGDVYDMVMNRGATVCRVNDSRGRRNIDMGSVEIEGVESPNEMIEDKLAERDVSGVTVDVENMVRNGGVAKTNLRGEAKQRIEEAQEEAFLDSDDDGTKEEGGE